ncbi:MAG: DUF115 domain-containing protein [Treponema sp.]|nr:DUF115 domain-containing protein [Treponema sp.]
MEIKYENARNGDKICSIDGIKLHSAYDPQKEAERFVNGLSCTFSPTHIVITGPALSYCVKFLRKRFDKAVLIAIHYSDKIECDDSIWDKTFISNPDDETPLSEVLYSYLGEEGISSALFASWQPSEKIFPDNYTYVWDEIKKSVIKSRSVLSTRTYFARRWIKNAIRFCLYSKNNSYITYGDAPIVICASGPSLKTAIPSLKERRNRFFLIAVSSALSALLEEDLIPDICISTDGGYWAKRHLSHYLKQYPNLPVALSAESACYGQIFDHPVIPLSYGDGPGETLLRECAYKTMNARRNGTVSGTAAEFAMSITRGPVFFCGLDLAPSKSYSHTQPNELEDMSQIMDRRLLPKETRLSPSSFPSLPLSTYLSWFQNKDFNGRLFRLSNSFNYMNQLGKTKDVDFSFFDTIIKKSGQKLPKLNFVKNDFELHDRKEKILSIINSHLHDDDWVQNALPCEYLIYRRSMDTDNFENSKLALEKGLSNFYGEIMRIISEN